ncbi:unnamed protein product [Rhizoctonia solani]|uniref:Uncharacterized protein n=1 Tax=Rhizoctonia solani TaxID=456999 RepID=A0A8H2X9A2_9AGAM|nr:unnamed protein product [Rhizoctonia solani]
MSTVTSFSPPLAQLSIRGEHLPAQTQMDREIPYQSLPSGEENITEVQHTLNTEIDELSTGENYVQIDELDEDPNNGLDYEIDLQASEQGVGSQHNLVQTDEPVDPGYEQNDIISSASEQALSVNEPTEAPLEANIITGSLLAQTDAILQAEAQVTETTTDNAEFVSLEEQSGRGISEEGYELSLSEQEISEISAMAEELAAGSEEMLANLDEPQLNEQDLNQTDDQTLEPGPVVTSEHPSEHYEDTSAPPLHRMDEDTIPVSTHSKDSIIDALNDPSGSTADESIQLAITEVPVPQESGTITSTDVISEQADIEMSVREGDGQLQESTSTSAIVHLDYVQALEPTQQDEDGDVTMELDQNVEQTGKPGIDAIVEPSTDHQPIQITEELSSKAQDESTGLYSTQGSDVDGPIIAVVEQSMAISEGIQIEPSLSELPSDHIPEVAKETTLTPVATTVVSADSTVTEPVVLAADAGIVELDHVERAVQIRHEQDATVQIHQANVQIQDETQVQDEIQANLATEPTATTSNVVFTDSTSDPTAPKDSDSLLPQTLSQSQFQITTESDTTLALDPIDPLGIEQDETDIPEEENSELAKLHSQVPMDPPTTVPGAEPSGKRVPERSSFGELDQEGEPDSPEPEEPSSEPSEYPDVVTEDSPLNPASASTDKAKKSSNSPAASSPKRKKPRMIVEVVIPIAPRVVGEAKPVKRRPGRLAKKAKATKAQASKGSESSVIDSSSPPFRPSSAGTPSVRSEASRQELKSVASPASSTKKPGHKRAKPFNSRKPVKKATTSKLGANTRLAHMARPAKVEVVMPPRPRPSLLRQVGSMPSGNSVKFASASSVNRKRKAESEPESDEGTDADADGETDDGYEDVEEEPKFEVEVVMPAPKSRHRARAVVAKTRLSPKKRPHRSKEARKTPTKLPQTLGRDSKSITKRRRLRR